MQSDFQERFIRIAREKGLLDEAALKGALEALAQARAAGGRKRLHDILLERGLLSREQLLEIRRGMAKEGVPVRVNDYEVISRIGRGGMGTVYLARQRGLDRLVALKTLSETLAGDQRYVERFLREARLAGRLNHPNVVRVFDTGEWRGARYIVMEYVEGRSLDRLVRSGELLTGPRAIKVMRQAADLLRAAQKAGIVHRDIKPGNIMLAADDAVKVADFGVACVVGEPAEPDVGTPYYISPEQARNDPMLDSRADIYSLGCTMFHALTGRPPFIGATALATVTMRFDSPAPDVREFRTDLSAGFAALLRRMMDALPEKRPDPAALAEELDGLASRERTPRRGRGALSRLWRGLMRTGHG